MLQLSEKGSVLDVTKLKDYISNCKACQFENKNKRPFSKTTWEHQESCSWFTHMLEGLTLSWKGNNLNLEKDIEERNDDGVWDEKPRSNNFLVMKFKQGDHKVFICIKEMRIIII